MRRWLMLIVGLALLVGLVAWTLRAAEPPRVQARLVGTEALQGPADAGFARVTEPRQFVFPRDHGPHPEYRTEWWYYTGNLDSADGEHLGFQLTFFRQAVAPEMEARASDWATRQVYMAHFAVTRASDDRFVSFERFSRGAAGLAGAQADPYRVWLEGWEAAEVTADGGRKTEESASSSVLRPSSSVVRLRAAEGPAAIDLRLRETKPIVLQGDQGLSQKSAEVGNASYYYSATRLQADGTVTLDGKTYGVNGLVCRDESETRPSGSVLSCPSPTTFNATPPPLLAAATLPGFPPFPSNSPKASAAPSFPSSHCTSNFCTPSVANWCRMVTPDRNVI